MPKICYIKDSVLLLNAPVIESSDMNLARLQHVDKFEGCFASLLSDEEYDEKYLQALKLDKISKIEEFRNKKIGGLLYAKEINGVFYFVKANPDKNLFESGTITSEGGSVQWGAFGSTSSDVNLVDTSIQNSTAITLSKSDLLEISSHYAARKNIAHLQCDQKTRLVDAMTSVAEVAAFDITATV